MKRYMCKGSYTIEGAIYIPFILFLMLQSLGLAIDYWQDSRTREVSQLLQEQDAVKEFYSYQIMDEIQKEITDDES